MLENKDGVSVMVNVSTDGLFSPYPQLNNVLWLHRIGVATTSLASL